MRNGKIECFFNIAQACIRSNPNLRAPQSEGWSRIGQHVRDSSEHAILRILASRQER